jgi:hypothetical protein
MSCARSRVEVRLISTSHYYSGAERSIGLREAVTVRTGQWEVRTLDQEDGNIDKGASRTWIWMGSERSGRSDLDQSDNQSTCQSSNQSLTDSSAVVVWIFDDDRPKSEDNREKDRERREEILRLGAGEDNGEDSSFVEFELCVDR